MAANRYGVSFWGDQIFLKLVMMVHDFENMLKTSELNTLKNEK